MRLNSRPFAGAARKTAVSHDGGETWSTVEDVPELPDPICNAAILRVSDPQGVPRIGSSSAAFGTRRERGTLHASWDDGRSAHKPTLWDGFFAYSALTVLPGAGSAAC